MTQLFQFTNGGEQGRGHAGTLHQRGKMLLGDDWFLFQPYFSSRSKLLFLSNTLLNFSERKLGKTIAVKMPIL